MKDNKQTTSYNARTVMSSRFVFGADHQLGADHTSTRPAIDFSEKPFHAVVQCFKDLRGMGWQPYSTFKENWCAYVGDDTRYAKGLINQIEKANARWPELCLVRWVKSRDGYMRIEVANGRDFE